MYKKRTCVHIERQCVKQFDYFDAGKGIFEPT